MSTSDFYRRLKDALRSSRLATTQVEIAKLLGLTQASVSRWKLGQSLPEHGVVMRISELTGAGVEWLYTGRGPMRPEDIDDDVREILDRLHTLDPETRKKVLSILRILAES